MKTHHMRLIDRFIGIPLCFICSLWHDLCTAFQLAKSGGRSRYASDHFLVENILFIELSELGSAIVAFSAIARAKALYPDAQLYFLIFEKNRESVELLGLIPKENILSIRDDDFPSFALSSARVLRKLKSIPIDTCIDLELFSRCTALISFLSGAKRRVGFFSFKEEGLYRGTFLTHRVLYNPHQHMSLNFLSLVCCLQGKSSEPLLKMDVSKYLTDLPLIDPKRSVSKVVREKLASQSDAFHEASTLIVLNPDPGEALPIRGWPISSYAELSRQIIRSYPDALLVIIGLEDSKYYAERIKKDLPPERVIDFTGRTNSLEELVTLFSMSELLITNDSGPAHLAALTNIHSIVLFGPETPNLYAPLSPRVTKYYSHLSCSPCLSAYNHRATQCTDNVCLKSIRVEDVLRGVRRALEGNRLQIAV